MCSSGHTFQGLWGRAAGPDSKFQDAVSHEPAFAPSFPKWSGTNNGRNKPEQRRLCRKWGALGMCEDAKPQGHRSSSEAREPVF